MRKIGSNTENVPKLISDTKPQMQESQGTPSRINVKKTTSGPGYIIIKLQKITY